MPSVQPMQAQIGLHGCYPALPKRPCMQVKNIFFSQAITHWSTKYNKIDNFTLMFWWLNRFLEFIVHKFLSVLNRNLGAKLVQVNLIFVSKVMMHSFQSSIHKQSLSYGLVTFSYKNYCKTCFDQQEFANVSGWYIGTW